jgi:transcriptional regulator with XRE-family HTH domain
MEEHDLQRQFGKAVRGQRKQRGYSQEGFADVLGVHRTYMGGVERAERNVTLKTVARFAKKLGMDPRDLLGP